MTIFDTIVAECTAPYKSALSVIRMAGKEAFSILGKMIEKEIEGMEPRRCYYCSIYKDKNDTSSLIDRGLVVLFKGKESFAGEDSVEFYVHGSRIIVEDLLDTLVGLGARRALGGEFSAKAYYNGKMDLTEAEAINQLVNARTTRSKDFALKTLEGSSSLAIKQMKEALNMLTAEIEVDIDYPEFDEEKDLIGKVDKVVPGMLIKAQALLNGSRQSKYLFDGVKVAIIGEPNVGKSTLLNKILGEEKAIVTPIPGTTRDIVEGEKEIDGIIYKFFDTAGIRKEADLIEELGIKKTYQAIQEADIILLLFEKGSSSEEETKKLGLGEMIEHKPCIYVSTKRDLNGADVKADISISKDDKDLLGLFNLIRKKLNIEEKEEEGFATQRDEDIMERFVELLQGIQKDIQDRITIDVVEIKLIQATSCLDEMLGVESTLEDIYDTVFKHFCVGK